MICWKPILSFRVATVHILLLLVVSFSSLSLSSLKSINITFAAGLEQLQQDKNEKNQQYHHHYHYQQQQQQQLPPQQLYRQYNRELKLKEKEKDKEEMREREVVAADDDDDDDDEVIRLLFIGDSIDRLMVEDWCSLVNGTIFKENTISPLTTPPPRPPSHRSSQLSQLSQPQPLQSQPLQPQLQLQHNVHSVFKVYGRKRKSWEIRLCQSLQHNVRITFLANKFGVKPHPPWHSPIATMSGMEEAFLSSTSATRTSATSGNSSTTTSRSNSMRPTTSTEGGTAETRPQHFTVKSLFDFALAPALEPLSRIAG